MATYDTVRIDLTMINSSLISTSKSTMIGKRDSRKEEIKLGMAKRGKGDLKIMYSMMHARSAKSKGDNDASYKQIFECPADVLSIEHPSAGRTQILMRHRTDAKGWPAATVDGYCRRTGGESIW